jgi:hypothetical protein
MLDCRISQLQLETACGCSECQWAAVFKAQEGQASDISSSTAIISSLEVYGDFSITPSLQVCFEADGQLNLSNCIHLTKFFLIICIFM